MKNWDVHGYNNSTCNAFAEPEPDAASSEAKVNLERWLFYFDRFNNHELSAKLDQELYERTEERMVEVQETSQLSWIESKFMKNAVDELTRCRVTLKWSYAMAYFLEKGNEKQIFEDIQALVPNFSGKQTVLTTFSTVILRRPSNSCRRCLRKTSKRKQSSPCGNE